MNDYCAANPDSLVIPRAVPGRATDYTWKCSNGTAVADTQSTEPDASGFLAAYWYKISPPQAVPTTGATRSSRTQLLVTLGALSLVAGRALRCDLHTRRE